MRSLGQGMAVTKTVLRDFETSSEWLESSVEGDFDVRFSNMEPWLSLFCFRQTFVLVYEEVIRKSILLAYFRDSGKRNFYICDL